ncbi:hypothetical protein LWF15_07005 [Kineosporia rhizophila]|uniref:uridine kinase family protein n=1 Tax=Kineosporia rhizophila TaxID=84633 RepID=UPI001E4536E0|nr:hypothetical protein [Kineosporia rhizophila]MCE0535252.1 hypothetical protein [Kineosporia rhizophila]
MQTDLRQDALGLPSRSVLHTLVRLVRQSPPSAGGTRLVAVDGRSGSGKSTLATDLAAELSAPLVRLDDLYEGWDGLPGVGDLLREWIADPLAAGGQARWRPYRWDTATRDEWRTVPTSSVLVLEGCGAGSAALRDHLALLVWVEASADVRLRRLRGRPDWTGYRCHQARWAAAEQALLDRENTPGHADVVVHNDSTPATLTFPAPTPPTL